MAESKIEPEVLPSTSQSIHNQKNGIFPLVSMPKIVLTRLDVKNLQLPPYKSPPPFKKTVKKPVKRLEVNKSKPLGTKTLPKKIIENVANVKHDTRFRGKPKKNYKFLSEMGTSFIETSVSKTKTAKVADIVKKVPKLTPKKEEDSVKGMLKKTMLQKRSKIAIPPAKKPKVIPTKQAKTNVLPSKLKEVPSVSPKLKIEVAPVKKDNIFQSKPMDTDADEDEFLYDELIDELVNSPLIKIRATEKKTNITLKPNIGNKPPTIVKGGIVKRSSLPPDLKPVTSPTALSSSKLTGSAPVFTIKPAAIENVIKMSATADSPKASLPIKASPFPIAINPSQLKTGSKNKGKRGPKKSKSSASAIVDSSPNINTSTSKQATVSPKQKLVGKSTSPVFKPRGRPRIGPKKVSEDLSNVSMGIEDESDEYTEVETLENIDSEPIHHLSNLVNDSTKDEDIQVIQNSLDTKKSDAGHSSETKPKKDEDPHLDLLRILTDDTVQSEDSELKEVQSENLLSDTGENLECNVTVQDESNSQRPEKSSESNADKPNIDHEADNLSSPQAPELPIVQPIEETSDNPEDVSEQPICETVEEETPPVRTVYDLINEVSLQYPSWNLHIIPETNAFCIAQVTRGRLGLPTLKKCIELDPDTYNAKVYIHQYHIKRFDGVYESEEAILALIEEIHSIKA